MNTFLSTLIVLAAVAQSSDVAVKPSSSNVIVQRSITVAQPPQQIRGTGISTSRSDYALNERPLSDQARAGVLVIPTPELTAESLAELTEDLTVMCRIFGKAVAPNRAGVGGYQPFRYVVDTQCVQGLYLDGYGALFFLDVDYPLLPEEQKEPVQSKPQEPGDPVWSQTIDEMTGRQSDEGRGGRAGPTYDAQRVENLKKTLVKTLAHAANIRTRRPQDIITLVVGSFDDTQTPYRTGTASPYGRTGVARSSSRTAAPTAPPAAALLVMRVAKSDVDAFSKGQLTLPEFTEKVQTLWSWPTWSASKEEKRPATPVPSSGVSTR